MLGTRGTWTVAVWVGGLGALLTPTPALADCIDGRPQTIGHRGTGNSSPDNPYPENTLPSILAAAEEGASMVELDVQLSADGIPVLMHDLRVETTTDGMGCVSELSVAELQQLDAGVGTPMAGTGIRVPTLDEVLGATTIDLDLELKPGDSGCPAVDDPQFVSTVLEVLDGDPATRRVLVSSFDFPLLEEVRAQDPEIAIGQLTVSPASTTATADAGFDALVLVEGSVDDAAVTTAREAGLDIIAWTADSPTRLAELLDLDLDGIITNEPPALEQVRAQACPVADESGGTLDGSGDATGATDGASTTETDGTASTTPENEAEAAGCGCRTRPAVPHGLALLLGLLGSLGRRRRLSTRGHAPSQPVVQPSCGRNIVSAARAKARRGRGSGIHNR